MGTHTQILSDPVKFGGGLRDGNYWNPNGEHS